jgi:hypothetical protein
MDQLPDVLQMPAMGLRRNIEIDLRTSDLTSQHWSDFHSDVIKPQSTRERTQPGRVETDAHEGAQGHVAGNTAEWIENRDSHRA